MRLIVDTSSLIWSSLLSGVDREYGKKIDGVLVNGWQYGYEVANSQLSRLIENLHIAPINVIFVVEGQMSKMNRQSIYSKYKESRSTRPPEAYESFNRAKDKLTSSFLNLGSQMCIQDGVEGDDIIAYLASKLPGDIVIMSVDGDMTTLINNRVSLYQRGAITRANKYGDFPHKFVPVYKALVGDGDEYKGAIGFGPKMFSDFIKWGGLGVLPAIEGMMKRRTLHELEDDVASFKPLRKVVDGAEHVYESYECALLHDEWVDTERYPLRVTPATCDWWQEVKPPVIINDITKQHVVFDCEIIGSEDPVFLVCMKVVETGERFSFWWDVPGDMESMHNLLGDKRYTFVSFNGINFDAPLMSAAIDGKRPSTLKNMAQAIIKEGEKAWTLPGLFEYKPISFDHIDLIEVAPGVRTSLKVYAGRMNYPTMVDLPFEHDHDLSEDERRVLEAYCQNDLGVTEALFQRLRSQIDLRVEMGLEHDMDLRSKSDAQVAEAVLKKAANITSKPDLPPKFVTYRAPHFIQTDSDDLNFVIEKIHKAQFAVNQGNGSVIAPDFLDEPLQLGSGKYQMGVGGLHSTTDKCLHIEATDEMLLSDFDVASYYPYIMVNAGIVPRIQNGAEFVAAYKKILNERIDAKRKMQSLELEISEIERELSYGI
jgi:hypothetical protein